MTDEEEQVPGVTFWFKGSALHKPSGPEEKYRVDLHLDAAVVNEELWEALAQKFKSGFRIYAAANFQEEVIGVMGKKSRELEAKLAILEKELAREKDLRAQTEAELAKYKEPLAAFGRGLRRSSER